MENKKINQDELSKLIAKKATDIRTKLNEDFKKAGDAHKLKMGHVAEPSDKDQALVMKSKTETKYKKGPAEKGETALDVKLNAQPSGEGHDKKIATAVEVKAGAAKSKEGVTKGQANANFTSKTDGPKAAVSQPFVENGKEDINQMDDDHADKEAPKTYVEAGAEKGGTDVTAGQHKANYSKKAPKSDKDERIAQGIQLKENYTATELKNLLITESEKLAKKIILSRQLENLKNEMKNY